MKLQNYVWFILLPLISFNSLAQDNEINKKKEKSEFWKRVNYGGGLGLNFSSNSTSINISPSAIYSVSNNFSTGIGINFGYTKFKIDDVKQFNYGLSSINLYNPFEELQLSAEFEYLFINQSYKIEDIKIKNDFNFPALYLGAGYRVGNFTAGLRYDILYNEEKSISSSAWAPFARFYF